MANRERGRSTIECLIDRGQLESVSAEGIRVATRQVLDRADRRLVTIEDAISAQFAREIAAFKEPTFEYFRRTRHAAQYFDPDAPEISGDDAVWAIDTPLTAVESARSLTDHLEPFDPS